MKRAAVGGLVLLAACTTRVSHLYLARTYETARDCVDPSTVLDVIDGEENDQLCPVVCLVSPPTADDSPVEPWVAVSLRTRSTTEVTPEARMSCSVIKVLGDAFSPSTRAVREAADCTLGSCRTSVGASWANAVPGPMSDTPTHDAPSTWLTSHAKGYLAAQDCIGFPEFYRESVALYTDVTNAHPPNE